MQQKIFHTSRQVNVGKLLHDNYSENLFQMTVSIHVNTLISCINLGINNGTDIDSFCQTFMKFCSSSINTD